MPCHSLLWWSDVLMLPFLSGCHRTSPSLGLVFYDRSSGPGSTAPCGRLGYSAKSGQAVVVSFQAASVSMGPRLPHLICTAGPTSAAPPGFGWSSSFFMIRASCRAVAPSSQERWAIGPFEGGLQGGQAIPAFTSKVGRLVTSLISLA